MSKGLDRDDRLGAGSAGHLHPEQADRAAPDDRDRAGEAYMAQVETM
jgi:hypothetical protein